MYEKHVICSSGIMPDAAASDAACHVNAGDTAAAGWHLDHVEVLDDSSGTTYYFPCNGWLDKSEGDGLIERLLKVGGGGMSADCSCVVKCNRLKPGPPSGIWPFSFSLAQKQVIRLASPVQLGTSMEGCWSTDSVKIASDINML